MQLEVQTAWSVDLNPPDGGVPEDPEDFEVPVQLSIGEVGRGGGEVFSFVVRSASVLSRVEPGTFVTATLVLQRFDWEAVRARVGKRLRPASCRVVLAHESPRRYRRCDRLRGRLLPRALGHRGVSSARRRAMGIAIT